MSDQSPLLFDLPPAWAEHWRGMFEFRQENQAPWQSVLIHFRNRADREAFSGLIGQRVHERQKFLWYPEASIARYSDKLYVAAEQTGPRYPVYIISKGRWESRLTSKALEAMAVPYRIVVEPQEHENYAAVIDPAKILVLPFSNLGQGSIPARNWVWEHATATGAERHWILDDNINGFYRWNDNLKVRVDTGGIFRAAEDFSDRYENVAMSGFNYFMFVLRKKPYPPITFNTRIYSAILLSNSIPYRWRGRYNEDTDLSLRILKDGLCTVLFNALLAYKEQTLSMKGGNTDELYKGDGRLKMAQSLQEQHPDVVKITQKWGRPQHHVNYKIFRRNKLKLKPGVVIPEGPDEYGMALVNIEQDGAA